MSHDISLRLMRKENFNTVNKAIIGSVSKICDLQFFSLFQPIWTPDKQATVFSNSVLISSRYSLTKLSPRCAAHRGNQKFCIVNQHFLLLIFSFMIYVFTPKRISPDCLFKSNNRQVIRFCFRGVQYFRGMLHTAEIISAVGCTPRRQLCDQISRRNRNQIRKYFSLFIRGPDGLESLK